MDDFLAREIEEKNRKRKSKGKFPFPLWVLAVGAAIILVTVIASLLALHHNSKQTANISAANQSQNNATGSSSSNNSGTSNTSQNGSISSNANAADNEACKHLMASEVKTFIGNDIKQKDGSNTVSKSSTVNVYTCSYSTGAKALNFTLRMANNASGQDANTQAFNTSESHNGKPVSGVGDKAFVVPPAGQIDVLRHGNWYIINVSNGAGAPPASTQTLTAIAKQAL